MQTALSKGMPLHLGGSATSGRAERALAVYTSRSGTRVGRQTAVCAGGQT